MRKYCFYISFLICLCPTPTWAQTVGNGSAIGPSAGELEDYGVAGFQTSRAQTEYSTRHYHRGVHSGIGGSFIGTTSPTAESTPAIKPVAGSIQTKALQYRLPKLTPVAPELENISALESYTPALPSRPRTNALVDPLLRINKGTINSVLDTSSSQQRSTLQEMPSFSNQPSITEQMQF